ncbi:MAG: hypothetical protein JWM58_2195 [Rhizobium sp.]|nr:hypothetical protein [Rhizobium sp.]
MNSMNDKPPFSYAVKVGHVSHNPLEVHVEADDRERTALAKLWNVLSLEELAADLKIRRWKKDGVKVFGEIRGKVTQACIVTLDPVKSEIHEEIDQIFVPEGSPVARIPANDDGELVIDPDGPDLPETFSGDTIDIGAIVAEFAAMGLDPYPRKPDAEFKEPVQNSGETDRKPSPFAVLKNLKIDN